MTNVNNSADEVLGSQEPVVEAVLADNVPREAVNNSANEVVDPPEPVVEAVPADNVPREAVNNSENEVVVPPEPVVEASPADNFLREAVIAVIEINKPVRFVRPASQNKNEAAVRKFHKLPLCSICWGDFSKQKVLATTICGHVFCRVCLKNWLRFKKECPTCRNKLKDSSYYHPLYL